MEKERGGEEMPATEKDLAEDAPWKKIQQNTFTRWCNEHLKCINKRINDLQKDLSDGLKLIGLLEVLSQKKMYRKYHSRPNFRQMKLENVSVALEFLEREHIKLVSIGEWRRSHARAEWRHFTQKSYRTKCAFRSACAESSGRSDEDDDEGFVVFRLRQKTDKHTDTLTHTRT